MCKVDDFEKGLVYAIVTGAIIKRNEIDHTNLMSLRRCEVPSLGTNGINSVGSSMSEKRLHE